MNFIILDLEWNTAFSKEMDTYVNEIIEFGAVKLNEDLEVLGLYSEFVKPVLETRLSPRVKKLTHITNDDINRAQKYARISEDFAEFIGDPDEAIIMSWGDMDIRALISNNQLIFGKPEIPYIKYYLDLQWFFMHVHDFPKGKQIGLSDAASHIGLDPDDFVHHRALADSLLTVECFKSVYPHKDLPASVVDVDADFYEQIIFKPYVITDINDPLVDRSAMSCQCIDCHKPAKLDSNWYYSGASFHAKFKCADCGSAYRINLQFKKHYNQVSMKKTVIKLKDKKPARNLNFKNI